MFELLVSGKGAHIDLTEKSMRQILKAGVAPTLWKIEGLSSVAHWKRLDKLTKTDMIVLGRGESKKAVNTWIRTAAKSGIPDGFAIGRTIFLKPLEAYRDKKITRREAIQRIAKNYLHVVSLWQKTSTTS